MSQIVFLSIATCLVALAGANFAAGGLSAGRILTRDRLRRYNTMKTLRGAAEIVRLDAQMQTSGGPGVDWRVMEVAEVVQESNDCRSFYLIDPYGQPLPDFRPGQYLMVRPAIAGAFQTSRCYSLSSAPDSRYWRITVKRQQPDPNRTSASRGGLSAWLHDNIRSGDCLLIGGPSGHFYLPADNTAPLVLLAAGVGITPMVSMLRWSLEHTPTRPVTLYYQVRDLDHWPLGEYITGWTKSLPHCRVINYFSRLTADMITELSEQGIDSRDGKFTANDVADGRVSDSDYFMCGPDVWMDELRHGLAAAGVAAQHIHWESFGGASVPGATPNLSADQRQVAFTRSQVEAVWEDPEQTLWELARANDVQLPSGCLSGVCGSCRVKVKKGSVAYDRPVSIELAEGECLSCIARPQSDLQIEA